MQYTRREIGKLALSAIPAATLLPRVVAAAPRLALALGHDIDDDDDAFGVLPGG